MDTLFVYLFFILGALLCAFVQAQIRVESPLNGYRSTEHYYSVNLWRIILRLFIGSMAFWGAATGHGQFNVFLPDSSWNLMLPWVAGLSGVGMDSGLSKLAAIAGLEKVVPPIGGTVTTTEKTSVTTEETATTTTVKVPKAEQEGG